jgi:hypothetical protein
MNDQMLEIISHQRALTKLLTTGLRMTNVI